MLNVYTKALFLFLVVIIIPFLSFGQRYLPVKPIHAKRAATQAVPSSGPTVCATSGADGTTNINGSINTYFPPNGDITLTAGSSNINLAGVPATDAHGNNFGTAAIKTGDLLLIIQVQDATIDFDNSVLYGSNNPNGGPDGLGATGFTDQGSSGKFEYVAATNNVPLTGGPLSFKGSGTGGGTVYTYTNAAATGSRGKRSFQVIRVPQYSNLRLTSNISPPPFNGSAGGIIAFEVAGNMDFNGFTVDVSARGFRGGYSLVKTSVGNISDLYVTNSIDNRASGKGEGIAGTPRYMWDGFNEVDNIIEGLPGGSAGRGAPANAGGGGNDANSGGGGGGNGNNGGVGGWGYEPAGGINPSGGRPGSKSFVNATPDDATRLIMGGGGGGGHANDALTGVKGGVGGGIVIINSRTISGSGTILANGGDGAPGIFGLHPDGSGGGGAGGSVFLKVSNLSTSANITVNAKGGRGGNTERDNPNTTGVQPHGPGGGGSGGLVFYNLPSGTFHSDVTGGASGRSDSGNGITHNAAGGGNGLAITLNVAALPPYLQGNNSICFPVLTTTLAIQDKSTPKTIGGTATYVLNIINDPAAGNAEGVQAHVALPTGFSYQSATVTYQGTATGPATISNTGSATGVVMGNFIIPSGGTVTINLVASIGCVASGMYNASAQAAYLDPTRDYTQPNRLITPKIDAFAGWNTAYQTTSFGDVTGSNYNGSTNPAEDATVINSAISNNVITQTPDNQFFCVSGDPSIIIGSIPVSNDAFTYQWQRSVDNITFTDIAGATVKDYDPGVIGTTTYYRRAVISASCPAAFVSNVITESILPVVSNNIITAPAISGFCTSGDPEIITGNIPIGGGGTYTYQWQSSVDKISFVDIAGATGQDYNPAAINVTTYYRRIAASVVCNVPFASNVVTLSIQQAISNNVITAPLTASFCSSADAAAITGSTPTGGDGTTYTYQWQKSTDNITFIDITGATAKDYDPPAANVTTYYRRTVTSGACTVPATSNVIIIKVEPALAANNITAPIVNTFCSSADAAVITGSTPTGGDGVYTYQWQSSADNTTFADIAGATAKDYDPPVLSATTYFRRVIISGSCTVPLASNVVSIQIQGTIPVTNNVITAPAAATFCVSGDPAVITGNIPSGGIGTFTYQWQSSADNVTFTDVVGATGQGYDPGPVSADTYYRRVASSGSCVPPVVSNVVGVKMLPALAGNTITAPPITTFCTTGDPAIITGSTPTGGNGIYTYQWQKSTDNVSFTDISGATGKDYDPAEITVTTYYRRLITSGACIVPLAGNVVSISIETAVTGNNITAPPVTSFCIIGDAATITGSTPTGGNGIFKYQWQISGDNTNFTDIPGAMLKDFDPPPVNASTYYRRTVLSGTCTTPSISNVVKIIILAVPATPVFAGTPPVICPGSSTTIAINAPQAGITYNWYSSAAKDNLLFSGTSFPTGPLSAAKTYYVEASNGTCSSVLAQIQVGMAPTPTAPALVENPVSVCAGSTATLNIQNPQAGFTYNWYSNATDEVPLNTGLSFITPAIATGATYYAEAVNVGGCASDTRTAVNVNTIALPQIAVNGTAICPGTTATLTVSSSDSDNTILWYTSASATTPVYTGNSFTTPNLNSSTSYYVGAVNASNCSIATRVKVNVTMLQQLDAPVVSVDATTNSSIAFKWNAVTGAKAYQVSIDNGQTYSQPSSGANGLSHTVSGLHFNEQVTILVQALGASSCQLSGSSTAVTGNAISPNGSQIYVANAFTPNGDGNNDIVYVHGEGIKSIAFYVYDQWGELIFTSTDKNKGWDGYYKGTREPVGVYVYYVKAVTNSGLQLNKKGTITLLR
jgi:gliding motility-associated-like protein